MRKFVYDFNGLVWKLKEVQIKTPEVIKNNFFKMMFSDIGIKWKRFKLIFYTKIVDVVQKFYDQTMEKLYNVIERNREIVDRPEIKYKTSDFRL